MQTFLIITTLAEYQTRFWLEVGLEMKRRGRDALFLSFDSRSNEMLAGAGLEHVDATASAGRTLLGERDPGEVCHAFGLERLNFWLTHEKYAFDTRDSAALLRKLAGSLLAAESAIARVADRGSAAMVQELGGFLSVIGSHFAALKAGIPSRMIEPSFFRSRMLFLEGSFAAKKLPPGLAVPVAGAVADYLADTVERSAIVIPEKDRHQYTTAFRKVINVRNFKRLSEKLVDKHLLGKEQEFGHIGSHVAQHVRMLRNSRRLREQYTALEDCGRFLYYPLHVPGDMALTLRSPEFLDQLALIDYLCRVAPLGVRVAVKEHPAMIGAIDAGRLITLTERHDNLAILPPVTNNFTVLRAAAAVVSVNSKSGAEAGLMGKPVVVLGDAFYRTAPFALPIAGVTELGAACAAVLSGDFAVPGREEVAEYFSALWLLTYPGELYVPEAGNVDIFTSSLLEAIE